MLLQHGIALQAETRPDAVALVSGETRIRYGELEALTNQLAHLLVDAGCQRGDRVGLLLPKTESFSARRTTLLEGCRRVTSPAQTPLVKMVVLVGVRGM